MKLERGTVHVITDKQYGDLMETDNTIVIDFWASWCAPCKRMKPIFKKVASEMPNIIFARMSTEKTRTPEELGIKSLPTFVMFRDGEPVSGIRGVKSEKYIRNWVNKFKNADGKKKWWQREKVEDDREYVGDPEEYIPTLEPAASKLERKMLIRILSALEEPLVAEKTSPHKLLSSLWEEHAHAALRSLLKDNELARTYYRGFHPDQTSTSQWLKKAMKQARENRLLNDLPDWKDLPELPRVTDELARLYLTKGEKAVISRIDKLDTGDTKTRSVAYSILLVLDSAAGRDYRFKGSEIEFARHIQEHVEPLLRCAGKDYATRLQKVIQMSGDTYELPVRE